MHVINSAIVKSSKLTIAAKVYRGVAGGRLPDSFWTPNEYNVRGGIEGAFLSTTLDRQVAFDYAGNNPGKPGLIFEVQMGMVDRGAELKWLSQCAPLLTHAHPPILDTFFPRQTLTRKRSCSPR